MALPRPTVEPQFAVCGDTLQFDKTISNFPATDGWALSYVLASGAGSGPQKLIWLYNFESLRARQKRSSF